MTYGEKIPRKLPGFILRMLYATSREINTSVLFPNCHCGKNMAAISHMSKKKIKDTVQIFKFILQLVRTDIYFSMASRCSAYHSSTAEV
jgi:hypothetical protein